VGLSLRKAEYLRDLALHFSDGRVHEARWREMDDELIIGELTGVRGIGRWTAEVYGARFTDMSPFRAIRRDVLTRLEMREETFGWNLEMQMKVAAAGLRIVEIPVGQRRRRGGVSKVSGDAAVALRAAWSIAATFVRLAVSIYRTDRAVAR
jgi:hypothetical protein